VAWTCTRVWWAWRSSATWKATRELTRMWAIQREASRPTTRKLRRSRSNSYQTGATYGQPSPSTVAMRPVHGSSRKATASSSVRVPIFSLGV
jgi:hypothetical protein